MPNIKHYTLTLNSASILGALPYIVGKLGLSCPIYATVPTYKMGQMFMYDLFQVLYGFFYRDLIDSKLAGGVEVNLTFC